MQKLMSYVGQRFAEGKIKDSRSPTYACAAKRLMICEAKHTFGKAEIMTSKGVCLKTMFATWHISPVLAENVWEKNFDKAYMRFYSGHHTFSTLKFSSYRQR
jgi:hypothetical protein